MTVVHSGRHNLHLLPAPPKKPQCLLKTVLSQILFNSFVSSVIIPNHCTPIAFSLLKVLIPHVVIVFSASVYCNYKAQVFLNHVYLGFFWFRFFSSFPQNISIWYQQSSKDLIIFELLKVYGKLFFLPAAEEVLGLDFTLYSQ